MSFRRFLLTAFAFAVVGVSAAQDKKQRPQPVTDAEAAAVAEVFGRHLNPKHIRKTFEDFDAGGGAAAITDRKGTIHFYGDRWHSADYAKDSVRRYSLFMHEVTHVWHLASGFRHTRGQDTVYHYTYDSTASRPNPKVHLGNSTRFQDFAEEQQAAMIQDYAAYFLFDGPNDNPATGGRRKVWGKPDPAEDALLMKTVEDFFPAARETRLKKEAARSRQQQPAPKIP